MAIDARSILNHQATDADHRTFAQAIHDMLIAAGLTQTADTGQANLATITRPSTGAVSGFEMFRFADTEQATLGCFIKVEYGTGNVATVPGLRITIGTGTNGAGTLSGASSDTAILSWASTADSVAQTRPAFASHAEGQLVVLFGQDLTTANRGAFHYVGRPRAYDGTRTTDGLLIYKRAGNMSTGQNKSWQIVSTSGPAAVNIDPSTSLLMSGQNDQVGANTALFPIPVAIGGAIRWSSMFAYRSASIAADAVQAVTVWGGSKNYRTLGNVWIASDVSFAVPYL